MDLIHAETLDAALAQVGLPCPSNVEIRAGSFCRFDDPEGKRGNLAAWCRPFPDGQGAVFGNWRTDQTFTWQKSHNRAMTKVEAQAFRQQVETARADALAAREAEYQDAAVKASQQWDAAVPATDAAYLVKKAIQPHGTRQQGQSLLVPVYNARGEIQSLQTVQPDGAKRFHPGGRMAGGRFWIGHPGPAIVICEGFATGAAIHEAAGLPVCVAFNAGNLLAVAQDLRRQHPDVRIILAADNDIKPDGPNVGRQKAQEAAKAVGGTVALPELNGAACDWWDVRHEQGDAALVAVFNPPPRFKLLNRDELRSLPDLEWRIDNVLPMTGIGLVIGQSGAGKSFVTLDLLARVSLGLPWFDHGTRPCKTVYVGLEGRAGIKRRIEAWERQNNAQVPDGFAVVLDTLKLTEQQDVHDLARAILNAGGDGGLIVIDTLAQASPGIDENSSADMGVLIEALQRLQAITGGLVLAVHHMGKDTTRGARGHSSLYASCDVVLAVTTGPQGRSVNTETGDGGKSKDAEPVSHAFDLGRVVLHTLADGHEIAGACVVPMEVAPRAALPKSPKGGNAKIVWDHLGHLLRDAGDVRPADAPANLPDGRPSIKLEAAIEQIGPQLTCEPKRRTERTRAAITSLVTSGLIEHSEGWLWIK
ncbi:AAA family ATPase [Castellaniella sp.]|uniref:AAA family ATPase n=1 Tax=Castellaniella sp. TaxID=1955812 RepID=UPI002AFE91FC|nr:AAA family ATPase [Castellaniella sp.]